MSYWSRSFRGVPASLAEVRVFVAAVVGDRPGAAEVILVVSELAANAILHSLSGDPGGQFVVHLAIYRDRWQMRIDDGGGPTVPRICSADGHGLFPFEESSCGCNPESGRGLALVAAMSRAWGVLGDEYSRAVWAEILFPVEDDTTTTPSHPEEA